MFFKNIYNFQKKGLNYYEGFSFRLIAFLESQSKGNAVKREELFKKVKEMSKIPKLELKNREENAVGKGVKIIWASIYKEPYRRGAVDPQFEKYNCPTHERNDCPPSCGYLKEWSNKFDRFYPI